MTKVDKIFHKFTVLQLITRVKSLGKTAPFCLEDLAGRGGPIQAVITFWKPSSLITVALRIKHAV